MEFSQLFNLNKYRKRHGYTVLLHFVGQLNFVQFFASFKPWANRLKYFGVFEYCTMLEKTDSQGYQTVRPGEAAGGGGGD